MGDYGDDEGDEVYQIRVANACQDIIKEVNLPVTWSSSKAGSDGMAFQVKCSSAMSLSFDEQEEIFNIAQSNMRQIYETCGWGWRPTEKRNELFHFLSRIYFIYDEAAKRIAGYAVFRYEFDDEEEPEYLVLYCYELQVRPEYKRQGLGSQMIDALDRIAKHFNMRKIMLTCFKINVEAMEFYRNIGFTIDENSPSNFNSDQCYEILSRTPHDR